EVAGSYLALRACEATRVQTEADAASRAQTARLTELAARAGFQAPADAALANAGAAQARATAAAQRSQCDSQVKALVSLSGLAEPLLRGELAAGLARLPEPAQIEVPAVPAQALAQRPDLYTSAQSLLAASADTDQARAQRWPTISLAGSVGRSRLETSEVTVSGTTWSLGPLSVSLPLFDGGVRQANVSAAQARYDAALSRYTADLRGAVREVEEALLALQSTASRSDDARLAAEGFESALRATEARQRGGLASLFELEDSRRNALQARSALIDLQRERVAAWISLYRALGGGWVLPAAGSPETASVPTTSVAVNAAP
ncbi:MAG TPA: TolC family protein, partial [Ideonella sp.]|nr:TolC family protein [Ideonella sp.]